MARSRTPTILARKQPKQGRSTQLVAAILEAAIRVLQAEGAQRFTMARVAEKAGVSVGSLYQYFPNKESILFQLQREDWLAAWSGRKGRAISPKSPRRLSAGRLSGAR